MGLVEDIGRIIASPPDRIAQLNCITMELDGGNRPDVGSVPEKNTRRIEIR